jgi:hypothetical protein
LTARKTASSKPRQNPSPPTPASSFGLTNCAPGSGRKTRRRPEPLAAGKVEALWADLAKDDAGLPPRAVWRLADVPEASLSLIRK